MDDLISRQALMQSLGITNMDCDKCAWHDNERSLCKRGGDFVDACCAIEDAPTVDAVEVVLRCKDCKHWAKTEGDERWSIGDCNFLEKRLVMCEGYCAWAERKE